MKGKIPTNTVYISLLGGFRLENGNNLLTDEINRSLKLWNVLCYLVMNRDRKVPQTELIETFWADSGGTNPSNSLKTLLYRLRAMLEPVFGEDVSPILSKHGAYLWNPDIHCELDIDAFEDLCTRAENIALDDEVRISTYYRALDLYGGDFFPKLNNGYLWVVPISVHYHNVYLNAVTKLCELLTGYGRFEEIYKIATKAIEFEPLSEPLHILIISSLLRQGKHSEALKRYEFATDLLYRQLGVNPSADLRHLYTEIMNEEKNLEIDLEVIQGDLRETASIPGAFLCEYGFFKEAYRLEARRSSRSGHCVHIGLLTITDQDGQTPPSASLTPMMKHLQNVLVSALRRGDVVAKYSASQFVILLPSANHEDSLMVMNRIVSYFHRQYRYSSQKLSYKIRALES